MYLRIERMKTAKQLQDKYESDLKKLQESCKHPDITDWEEEFYMPAHSSGTYAKFCKICGKILERKKPKVRFKKKRNSNIIEAVFEGWEYENFNLEESG